MMTTARGGLGGRRGAALFGGLGTTIAAVLAVVLLTNQPLQTPIPIARSVGCGLPTTVVPGRLTQIALTYPLSAVAPYTASVSTPSLANRAYQLYLPDGYNAQVAYPLLVGLHFYGGTGTQFENVLRMDDIADKYHIILAFPEGTLGQAAPDTTFQSWDGSRPPDWPGTNYGGVDDVGFLNAVQQQIGATACVNTADEGLYGFSAGGAMTWFAACQNATWFRAVAVIESGMFYFDNYNNPAATVSHCYGSGRNIPALVFAGTADTKGGDGLSSFPEYEPLLYWTGQAISDTLTTIPSGIEYPYVTTKNAGGMQGEHCQSVTVPYSSTEVFEQVYSQCDPPAAGIGPNNSALFSDPGGGHAVMGGWDNPPGAAGYGCTAPQNNSGGILFSNRTTCQVNAADIIARFLTTGSTYVDPAARSVNPLATPLH